MEYMLDMENKLVCSIGKNSLYNPTTDRKDRKGAVNKSRSDTAYSWFPENKMDREKTKDKENMSAG